MMLSSAVKNQPELSITRGVQVHQPEMVEFCRKLSYTIIIQKGRSDFNRTAELLWKGFPGYIEKRRQIRYNKHKLINNETVDRSVL